MAEVFGLASLIAALLEWRSELAALKRPRQSPPYGRRSSNLIALDPHRTDRTSHSH